MTAHRPDLALHRLLDALEAELLSAPAEEIRALVAETGMSAQALLAEAGIATALNTADVGWVERSETHHPRRDAMGFATLYPSYKNVKP